MSNAVVRALYSFPGLAKLADIEGLKLTRETNRMIMCHIISKIGVTVGQKIAYKRENNFTCIDIKLKKEFSCTISQRYH